MPPTPSAPQALNLPWNPRLAHLRGLAALFILVFHVFHSFFGRWQPQPGPSGLGWIVEGHTGVGLFFVLSGYLFMSIALPRGGRIPWGEFQRNRLLRVAPLYLLFFILALSIGRDTFRPADLLYALVPNLGDPPTSRHFITGAAWTLGVEFGFYLVFPFLARFAVERGPRYLIQLIALLLLLKAGAWGVSERPTLMVYSTLLGRLDQFLIGMLAAQLAQAGPPRRGGLGALLAAVLALGLALEGLSLHASYFSPQARQPLWIVWPTVEALLWAGLLRAYLRWDGRLPAWLDRFLAWVGELSYSLYLGHALVVHVLVLLLAPALPAALAWAPWHLWAVLLTVLAGALSLALAALSHRVIEQPFMALRRAYSRTPAA